MPRIVNHYRCFPPCQTQKEPPRLRHTGIAALPCGAAQGVGRIVPVQRDAGALALTLPPALNAALGALSPERGGVGNAVLQAMRQVGGAIGVAVLGAVLNSAYRGRLDGAPAAARESVTSGVAVASGTGDAGLLDAVRGAFTYGMDRSLIVAGVLALAGAALALVVMPARAAEPQPEVLAESLL